MTHQMLTEGLKEPPDVSVGAPNVLLIVPAYNEAVRLPELLARARSFLPGASILVVDDGSADETPDQARKLGAYVARHPFNLGYGAALQTGYRFAVARGYELVVQMDADGQHDPSYVEALLKPVRSGRADVAIGSRYRSPEKYPSPLARRMGSFLFGALASLCTGRAITDPTSGFWAMNRSAVTFCGGESFPHDYPDADVLIALHRAGFRIEEVSVRMFPPEGRRSMHAGFRPLYYVFKMSLSIFVSLLRRKLPYVASSGS